MEHHGSVRLPGSKLVLREQAALSTEVLRRVESTIDIASSARWPWYFRKEHRNVEYEGQRERQGGHEKRHSFQRKCFSGTTAFVERRTEENQLNIRADIIVKVTRGSADIEEVDGILVQVKAYEENSHVLQNVC